MMVMKYKKKCCENVSTGGNTGQGDDEFIDLAQGRDFTEHRRHLCDAPERFVWGVKTTVFSNSYALCLRTKM